MNDHRLGAVAVALGIGWFLVAAYVVIGQLPSAALELPGQRDVKEQAMVVAPQGWAFFTKSARDPNDVVWRRGAGGGWHPAEAGPHSEARNLFGWNRGSRAQAADLGILVTAVPAAQWATCDDGRTEECLSRVTAAFPLRNPAPEPRLCGEIGVARQEPLPWAWAGAADRTRMPVSVVRLEVAC
ncbi:SdpA family antimicrobial peptide system protein [Herbidospora sp. RD11066]